MFNNYRIPRENLLNRTADVTPDGEYESSFTDPGRILGAALENLSMGRVGIMQESSNNLICAVTIAVRYAAVRKQFAPNGESGKNNSDEWPIIEYQLHVSKNLQRHCFYGNKFFSYNNHILAQTKRDVNQ